MKTTLQTTVKSTRRYAITTLATAVVAALSMASAPASASVVMASRRVDLTLVCKVVFKMDSSQTVVMDELVERASKVVSFRRQRTTPVQAFKFTDAMPARP